MPGTLNGSGFGYYLGNLKTVGTYALTVSAGPYSGTSTAFTVIPAFTTSFTVSASAAATTGTPIGVTVTAFDHYGNIDTSYNGTVKLTSTDGAAFLGNNYTFMTGSGRDNGSHTFSVTLNTAGNQTITATDTALTNPLVTGSSGNIVTRGLLVTSLTPTADGFIATFNKPFLPADLALYGASPNAVDDVVMTGAESARYMARY